MIVLHIPTHDAGNKYQFQDAGIDAFNSLSGSDVIEFDDTNTGEPRLNEKAKFFNAKQAAWFEQIRAAGWVDAWRHSGNKLRRCKSVKLGVHL